jgi:hypothetical protein
MALIANPNGLPAAKTRTMAKRLPVMTGATIALVSNQKPGATSLLQGLGTALRRDHRFETRLGTKPSASVPHPDLLSVRSMGDAAVLALGD